MNNACKNKWVDGLLGTLLAGFCLYSSYGTWQAYALMQDLTNNVEKYRQALLDDFKSQCRSEKTAEAEQSIIDRCAERRLEQVLQENKEYASQEGMMNGVITLASGIMTYNLFRREKYANTPTNPRPPEMT
ncbi:MAG: hypothetical protein HY370_09305 [Proteobacteria bacterium]|nr:hypothetical protein [Pseudomonadota bacterium]